MSIFKNCRQLLVYINYFKPNFTFPLFCLHVFNIVKYFNAHDGSFWYKYESGFINWWNMCCSHCIKHGFCGKLNELLYSIEKSLVNCQILDAHLEYIPSFENFTFMLVGNNSYFRLDCYNARRFSLQSQDSCGQSKLPGKL